MLLLLSLFAKHRVAFEAVGDRARISTYNCVRLYLNEVVCSVSGQTSLDRLLFPEIVGERTTSCAC